MRRVISVNVTGFSANDARIDGTLELFVILNDGKTIEYKTTGKMTLKEIVNAIVEAVGS